MKLFTDFLLVVFIITCAENIFACSVIDAPTATYSLTARFSPIICATENEKSTDCGSKRGKACVVLD